MATGTAPSRQGEVQHADWSATVRIASSGFELPVFSPGFSLNIVSQGVFKLTLSSGFVSILLQTNRFSLLQKARGCDATAATVATAATGSASAAARQSDYIIYYPRDRKRRAVIAFRSEAVVAGRAARSADSLSRRIGEAPNLPKHIGAAARSRTLIKTTQVEASPP